MTSFVFKIPSLLVLIGVSIMNNKVEILSIVIIEFIYKYRKYQDVRIKRESCSTSETLPRKIKK